MAGGWNSNGNAKRKLRERMRKEGAPCHLCGRPIDYTLPASDPWSFQLDHIVPIARGGAVYDPENVAPAHRICNARKGKSMPGDGCPTALPIKRTRTF